MIDNFDRVTNQSILTLTKSYKNLFIIKTYSIQKMIEYLFIGIKYLSFFEIHVSLFMKVNGGGGDSNTVTYVWHKFNVNFVYLFYE